MTEEEKQKKADAAAEEKAERKPAEQKIMCFVSKKMVPLNETVEVEYAPGKKVRVMPKYVKYDLEAVG